MLRKCVPILLMLLMIFNFNILAKENESQTTKIEDEKTPLADKKKDYTLYYVGMATLMVFTVVVIINKKHNNIELILDEVEDNHDGSYIIHLGYQNISKDKIKFNEEDVGLRVIKGNAILLKRDTYNEFECGNKKDAIIAVINKDSEIEYYVGNNKMIIKGSSFEKGKGR